MQADLLNLRLVRVILRRIKRKRLKRLRLIIINRERLHQVDPCIVRFGISVFQRKKEIMIDGMPPRSVDALPDMLAAGAPNIGLVICCRIRPSHMYIESVPFFLYPLMIIPRRTHRPDDQLVRCIRSVHRIVIKRREPCVPAVYVRFIDDISITEPRLRPRGVCIVDLHHDRFIDRISGQARRGRNFRGVGGCFRRRRFRRSRRCRLDHRRLYGWFLLHRLRAGCKNTAGHYCSQHHC